MNAFIFVHINLNKLMFKTILDFFEDCVNSIKYAFQYHSSEFKWCEFQYIQSTYVVEFWNSLTSLFITLVGIYGLYQSSKRAKIFYSLLIFIGLASAYFHSTLSFAGQLLDELGITAMMLMANYTIYSDDTVGMWLISIFGIIQLFVQFTYSEYNRFVLFLYAVLFVNKFWLALCSRDKKTRWYSHITIALFLMSVVCWICDFYVCDRNSLINFHGIWHIFIGLTAYFTIETCLLIVNPEQNLPIYSRGTYYEDEIIYLF